MRTFTVATDRFQQLARAQARALGAPDLGLEVVPHPLAGLEPSQVAERGRAVGERVLAALRLAMRTAS